MAVGGFSLDGCCCSDPPRRDPKGWFGIWGWTGAEAPGMGILAYLPQLWQDGAANAVLGLWHLFFEGWTR